MANDSLIFFLTALFIAAWIALVLAMWVADRIGQASCAEITRLYEQLKKDLAHFERIGSLSGPESLPAATVGAVKRPPLPPLTEG